MSRRGTRFPLAGRRLAAVTSLVLALLACHGAASRVAPSRRLPSGATTWAAETVSLDSVRALLAAIGVPEFFRRVSRPSNYLTDFFGIQALNPVPREVVLRDLVPRLGAVVSQSPHALVVQLTDGPRVEFRYQTVLHVERDSTTLPWARVMYGKPSDYFTALERFRNVLRDASLTEKYLPANPYSAFERTAAELMQAPAAEPKSETDTSRFGTTRHAIALLGDLHGSRPHVERALRWIARRDVDWVAFEMLTTDMRDVARDFSTRDTTGARFIAARRQMREYFSHAWAGRFGEPRGQPEQNPYYAVVDSARRAGKRIYALDAGITYTMFRFGEFPLGAATRNCVWAAELPTSGRGVVYGGSSHFTVAPSFQRCLRLRDPLVEFFDAPAVATTR